MNILKTTKLLILAAIVAAFSSCKDDIESSSLTLDNYQTAELKAYVYADMNIPTPGLEVVPAGTRVVISTPYNAFNPSAKGVWSDTLKTDANGMISATVKVASTGSTYTIAPIDFESIQTQDVTSSEPTMGKIFKVSKQTTALMPMDHKILEFTYGAQDYDNTVEFVNVNLYINGEFNSSASSTGLEVIPSGISITLQSRNNVKWSTVISNFETTTVSGVNYSKATVKVKKGDSLTLLPFYTNRIMNDGSTRNYKYYYTSMGTFSINNDNLTYTLASTENVFN